MREPREKRQQLLLLYFSFLSLIETIKKKEQKNGCVQIEIQTLSLARLSSSTLFSPHANYHYHSRQQLLTAYR